MSQGVPILFLPGDKSLWQGQSIGGKMKKIYYRGKGSIIYYWRTCRKIIRNPVINDFDEWLISAYVVMFNNIGRLCKVLTNFITYSLSIEKLEE